MKQIFCRILTAKSIFCLLFVLTVIGFSSCEKEVYTSQMELFYNESQGLTKVSIDSIQTFTTKFGSYVQSYPESRQDEYIDPTLNNIRYAASLHGYQLVEIKATITINDEWDGENIIYF